MHPHGRKKTRRHVLPRGYLVFCHRARTETRANTILITVFPVSKENKKFATLQEVNTNKMTKGSQDVDLH